MLSKIHETTFLVPIKYINYPVDLLEVVSPWNSSLYLLSSHLLPFRQTSSCHLISSNECFKCSYNTTFPVGESSEKDLESFKQLESSQKEQKNTKQDKSAVQLSFIEQKNQKKRVKKLKNRIGKLEKQIEELERSQKEIDLQLSEPEKFKELSRQEGFFEQYEKNQNIKKELESEWEQAIEALEHL